MKGWIKTLTLLAIGAGMLVAGGAQAWTPVPVKDDPLVRMPGTQPVPENAPDIESPGRCLNCHAGFNQAVEPGFNWKGSMMAQAARDFLFWSCLTVGAQDSIWAVGRPNATDICLRCHFPQGWLEGRSDPTNGSLMTGSDFDGVHCDFCHSKFDPFFKTTFDGTREGNNWLGYWDETNSSPTPSQPAALKTYNDDVRLAAGIRLFKGGNFYANNLPPSEYTENASGQFFMDDTRDKRASFADASARHGMFYSRYHKSKFFCSTCHDVSNPILANLLNSMSGDPNPSAATLPLHTETNPAYSYFHVERTFSEFMLSAYGGTQGGAPGIGPFAPSVFQTSLANNYIARCQDCHMRDGVGRACSQNSGIIRPTNSIEHPKSGQPIHDLTGGNAWVSTVLASAVSGSPNYDATNSQLLNQGPNFLTLDLRQGEGIDPVALLAGADRAMQQLELAASITAVSYDAASGALSFRVQNQTGHKLISGFPEGRRMFVNIKAKDGNGVVIYEVNPYDYAAGTLAGLNDPAPNGGGYHYPYADPTAPALLKPRSLGANEVYVDQLVYEMHPTSTLTGETESFHFALATGRYKDNRIPPKGFAIAGAAARQSTPVWKGVEDPNYFTAAEYAGGYDEYSLTIGTNATSVEITLYYQTTSREYVEFLRDEIQGYTNNPGHETLLGTGKGGDPAYIAQTDPWFSRLAAWGDTIWALWKRNMNVTTAKPYMMTQAIVSGQAAVTCTATAPVLNPATAANRSITLTWNAVPNVMGYRVYYDQAGKAALIADIADPAITTFTDTGLTNGLQYCYKVTSYVANCESAFSNIVCAVPKTTGIAGVNVLQTGYFTGKGNSETYNLATDIMQGSEVGIRAYVVDAAGVAVANADVTINITGPSPSTTSVVLATARTTSTGMAEVRWQTSAPNKRGVGGTTLGSYTATVTNVTHQTLAWDGIRTTKSFNIISQPVKAATAASYGAASTDDRTRSSLGPKRRKN